MSRSAGFFSPPHTTASIVLLGSGGRTAAALFSLKHARSTEGTEKAENEGVLAVAVNIIRHSSCGINVAHVGGRSRGEMGALRRSDEEKIEGEEECTTLVLTFREPHPIISLDAVLFLPHHLAEALHF